MSELALLLQLRTLLITVELVGEKLKVNMIPARTKEGEDQALTSPLCFTGSAEELDVELGKQLVSYVEAQLDLTSALALGRNACGASGALETASQEERALQDLETRRHHAGKTFAPGGLGPGEVTIHASPCGPDKSKG